MNRRPNCICNICEKPIYRRPADIERGQGKVCCSQACFGKSCRTDKLCPVCGKELINARNKKTCSRTCANQKRTGIRYTGEARKDKVKAASALKLRLVQQRGKSCERCGYSNTKILVVHHVKRRCDGGLDDLDNLEIICPNCHAEIHYGGVTEPVERVALEKRKT